MPPLFCSYTDCNFDFDIFGVPRPVGLSSFRVFRNRLEAESEYGRVVMSWNQWFFSLVTVLSLSFSAGAAKEDLKSEYLLVMDELPVDGIRTATLGVMTHGLQSKVYWTAEMEASFIENPGSNSDLRKQASESFYRLLRDVSIGGIEPQNLGVDFKIAQRKFIPVKDLRVLALANNKEPKALMEALVPNNMWYRSLRESLKYVHSLCQSGMWGDVEPIKKELKLGSKNPAIVQLKVRMSQYGYQFSNPNDVFDQDTLKAVNDIQATLRWKPDGKISKNGRTWKYLNTSCEQRLRQVQADMEKIRWFPQTFEDRYIFVNLAFSQFVLTDRTENHRSMNFRTINGRPQRMTPMMRDKVSYVILNPFWVVPPTIFIEDKVEEIKKLNRWQINAYFDSHNYEVWNKQFTRKIDPSTIDWWSIEDRDDIDIYIRQKPHTQNALGIVKFMLTNSYSIYMHDTNARGLFAEYNRQLSSGCVRVEKPLDLAEYLLQGTEWDRQAIEATVAKPGEVMAKDTKIRLTQTIPVYFVNMTSQLSSDRVLRFADDTYKQNIRIWSYLRPL